jgi:hypothetical protein
MKYTVSIKASYGGQQYGNIIIYMIKDSFDIFRNELCSFLLFSTIYCLSKIHGLSFNVQYKGRKIQPNWNDCAVNVRQHHWNRRKINNCTYAYSLELCKMLR